LAFHETPRAALLGRLRPFESELHGGGTVGSFRGLFQPSAIGRTVGGEPERERERL
jgi:hypothetical protein